MWSWSPLISKISIAFCPKGSLCPCRCSACLPLANRSVWNRVRPRKLFSNARERPWPAFAGLEPPDVSSPPRREACLAVWRRPVPPARIHCHRQDPEEPPPRGRQPHHHREPERSHSRVVEDVRHLRGRNSDWARGFAHSIRHHFVSGDARVHNPGAHAPQRSPHLVLELLRHYAVAVLPHRHPVVRLVCHHDSGGRLHFYSTEHGRCRRYGTFSGARFQTAIRHHGMRLLAELRPRAAASEDS